MNEPNPHDELAWLSAQAHRAAELDQLLGIRTTPVPPLTPFPRAAVAPPQPVEQPKQPASNGAGSMFGGEEPPQLEGPPQEETPLEETGEELEARRGRNNAELERLAASIQGCVKCKLHEGRTQLVFGQGDPAAELVFVGEAPGYHEDKRGLAFVGAAGELLTKMIGAMGLRRDEVFIANIAKCRPPNNRKPQPDEMATCIPYLEQQLDIVRPRVICALGRTAGEGLGVLRESEGLGRARGRSMAWRGVPVVLTYHPAYLLRNPKDKGKAWQDLQRLFPFLRRRNAS